AKRAQERGHVLAVARGVIGADAAPPAVRHRHERAARARLERHLDLGLLARREVRGAPFEYETRRRLPRRHAPRVVHARAGGRLERFEEPPAHARLDAEDAPLLAEPKLHARAPPL